MTRRPRLRLVLAIVNVILVSLPLIGFGGLRLYDNALIRETESELIAQSAVVAALFQDAVMRAALARGAALPPDIHAQSAASGGERWRPRPAAIDLADAPLYPAPRDSAPGPDPDPDAAAAGARIMPVIITAQRTTLAAIRVVDRAGVVVASTGDELGHALGYLGEVEAALDGRGEARLRQRISDEPRPALTSISRGAGMRIFVSTPVTDRDEIIGAVLASRTPRTIDEVLYDKRLLIGGLVVALLAGVLALALFTSLTVTRPVEALIAQARRAMRGEQGAVRRLAHPVTREVEELSDAVATMARTLEDRAEYIRTFASHVSHEFKSPLTAIRGAAELLEDHGDTMTEVERHRFLDNIVTDARRLSRLCGRLLELARADTAVGATTRSCLGPILAGLLGELGEDDLALGVDDATAAAWVGIDAATLASILASLVDNARQHGAGEVRINASMNLVEPIVEVCVADDGPGISAENAERIFEPFFTTARDRGGTGLGLSVAARLLRAHQGDLRLLHRAAPGAVFQVRIPVVQ